ncbi:MAG: DUF58 domain-containing protein [Acidobacteriota bacterium]|nr:DUF58 domain-containing protein [Acidobacteriota bacterium]MDE3191131.1 DUF58 domain-containing protein [Acidobacteriota bacterium]
MTAAVFPLIPRRRVVGLAFGGVRSVRRGIGSDVASTRPYRPGDDVAWMDWAASAKLSAARGEDEFIVRERYADEAPRVVVVCDRRPSMGIRSSAFRTLDKPGAILAALDLIGTSAHAARSLTGYVDHAYGGPFWRPPRSERLAEPGTFERPFGAPEDAVARGLAFLGEHRRELPTQAFVFVLSDFLVPPDMDAWQRALEHQWELVPVVLQDPVWESSFPPVGGITIPYAQAGSGRVVPVYVTDAEATRIREDNEARRDALVRDFRSLGIEPVDAGSHDYADLLSSFLRWADVRQMWRGAVA